MSSLFDRVMKSPYLSSHFYMLHKQYLLPDDVLEALEQLKQEISLLQKHHSKGSLFFRPHTLGMSTSGCSSLLGWTLGDPHLPRIVCASQHHGPENVGPSFCFYLSYLLMYDPLFQPWLDQYSFSFFPQQNPDGLMLQGNHKWMTDPHWKHFLHFHQYDPRQWDVEHGVLGRWFNQDFSSQSTDSFRTETLGLIQWIQDEVDQYGPIYFYLSGHSWDLLDAPLYLVYPNQSPITDQSLRWSQRITQLSCDTPYRSLTPYAPLTEEYLLPPWHSTSTPLDGFFVLPTQSAFKAQNKHTSVRQSTLDYVYSLSPDVYACVVEPPIFTSSLFQDSSSATPNDLQSLSQAIHLHQTQVNQLTLLLSEWVDLYTDNPSLALFSHSQNEQDREYVRLVCELKERQKVDTQWASLLTHLQSSLEQASSSSLDSIGVHPTLTRGQVQLAQANQLFHAGNLTALGLRVLPFLPIRFKSTPAQDQLILDFEKRLSASLKSIQDQLEIFKLEHWPISQSCFVYLNAMWAYIDSRS